MEKLPLCKEVLQEYNKFYQNNMVLREAILIKNEDEKQKFESLKEEALKLIGRLTSAKKLLVRNSTKRNEYSKRIENLNEYTLNLNQMIININNALYKKT